MTPANRNPLTPNSLAVDGMQGADCKADGHCGAKHSLQGVAALFLARVAMEAAQAQLEAYGQATDHPDPTTVEAADLLDAARAALDGAP